jgi:hypothetical protein
VTGTLTVGGQPPGSVVTNLSGVGMLRAGRDPEVNGRTGSCEMSSPRARLFAAGGASAALRTGSSFAASVKGGSGAARVAGGAATGMAAIVATGGAARAGVTSTACGGWAVGVATTGRASSGFATRAGGAAA